MGRNRAKELFTCGYLDVGDVLQGQKLDEYRRRLSYTESEDVKKYIIGFTATPNAVCQTNSVSIESLQSELEFLEVDGNVMKPLNKDGSKIANRFLNVRVLTPRSAALLDARWQSSANLA